MQRIGEKSVLESVVCRLRMVRELNDVVVLTSNETSDDIICSECERIGVRWFRGSLQNVALRFHDFLEQSSDAAFLRVSGDSPLIDPILIKNGLDIFAQGNFDIVSNVYPRSFPHGQSVEILRAQVFQNSFPRFRGAHREHVTTFFYEHPTEFRIGSFRAHQDFSRVQLSVDTAEDLRIINHLHDSDPGTSDWLALAQLWKGFQAGNST